jgi:hypothetical protein
MPINTRKIGSALWRGATAMRSAVFMPLVLLAGCATQLPPGETPTPSAEETVTLQPARELSQTVPAQPVTTQEQTALRRIVADQERLYRVAAPLLISNATLCKGSARRLLGFIAKTRHSYSSEFVHAAESVLGFDDRLQVAGVLVGSGAARAGIQQGDVLLAVEGTAMPTGPDAERRAAALLSPLVETRSVLKLTLLRKQREMQVDIPLTLACAYGIEVGNTDSVNSYADGRRILVTRGMADFARDDQELAYVIAREMAHNALAHPSRKKNAPALAALIDELIHLQPNTTALPGPAAIKPYSQSFDTAADRVALHMLARAGYPIDPALAFWQRLAKAYPAKVSHSHTALHPSSVYRWPVIKRTVKAIKAKQAAGKPLVP